VDQVRSAAEAHHGVQNVQKEEVRCPVHDFVTATARSSSQTSRFFVDYQAGAAGLKPREQLSAFADACISLKQYGRGDRI
jgi:hypothetical protein